MKEPMKLSGSIKAVNPVGSERVDVTLDVFVRMHSGGSEQTVRAEVHLEVSRSMLSQFNLGDIYDVEISARSH